MECPCTAYLMIQMLTANGILNAARFDDGFLTVTGDAAPTTNTVFYHGDQLGSTRVLTDSAGATTWSATYLPFGQEWNPYPRQTTTNSPAKNATPNPASTTSAPATTQTPRAASCRQLWREKEGLEPACDRFQHLTIAERVRHWEIKPKTYEMGLK
jgi:uncharacterized protein RhaS with RHS repeats